MRHTESDVVIRFLEASESGGQPRLIFLVGDRRASVQVRRRNGRVHLEFPHVAGECGKPFPDPAVDEAVLERARQVASLLEASSVWSRWTRRGR